MAENFFEQYGFENDEPDPIAEDVPTQGPKNYFSVFDSEPDAVTTVTKSPPAATPTEQPFEEVPGVSWVDRAYETMNRDNAERKRKEKEALDAKRGNSFLEGITDPQQYGEFAKGVIPGAVRFAGTSLKGVAGLQSSSMQASKTDAERQLAMFDSLDRGEQPADTTGFEIEVSAYGQMTPEQKQAYRQRLEGFASPVTPVQERTMFQTGQKVTDFAETILPADPAYREAVGRQLGEGIGSMIAGLPAAWLGPVPATVFFGAGGSGEAVERAIQHDKQLRKEGKAGLTEEQIATSALWGIGPGVTDVAPIELLFGRLKIPKPFSRIFANAVGRIGGQAFVEGVQEGGQQFLQNFIAQELYNPDQSLSEGIRPNTEMGAGVGGIAATAKELITSFAGGRHRGGASQPVEEQPDLSIEEIAKAIDNPQEVARETKQDKLEVQQPVEGVQEAPVARESLIPLENDFFVGTKEGEKFRVSDNVASSGGGILFERRFQDGKGQSLYVGIDGELLPADDVNFWIGAEEGTGKEQIWIPSSDVSRRQAADALYALGQSAPDQANYVDILDRIKKIVEDDIAGKNEAPIADETAVLAPEQQSYEQETILPAIEEIDAEAGSPVLADAYSRLTPDEKTEIISRISENEEDIADLIEEIAIRNEDAPTIAAMAIRRGLNDQQIAQVRELIAQQSPELAAGFDELVASLPRQRKAKTEARRVNIQSVFNRQGPEAVRSELQSLPVGELRTIAEAQQYAIPGGRLKKSDLIDNLVQQAEQKQRDRLAAAEGGGFIEGTAPARAQRRTVEQQVSDAYWRLTQRPQDWVRLADLRSALPDVPRAELDAALKSMYLGKVLNLASQDDQGSLTQADRDASMRMGASRIDMLSMRAPIGDRVTQPETSEADARRQFAAILNSRTPRSKWASELGIVEAGLEPLIEEAIRKGFLRRDKNGNVRRVPKSQRSGSFAAMAIPENLPETMPGDGDVALTPEAEEVWPEAKAAINRAASAILPDAVSIDVRDNIAIATLRKEDEFFALQAFHASPQDFAVFSAETAGKGQGMAVRGPGLYLGSTDSVAKFFGRLIASSKGELDPVTRNYLNMHQGDFAATAAEIAKRKKTFKGEALKQLERAEEDLKSQPSGYLYEAIIDAESDNIVIADEVIGSQPAGEKLASLIGEYNPGDVDVGAVGQFQEYNPLIGLLPEAAQDLTGEQALALLRTRGLTNKDFAKNGIFVLDYSEGDAPILGERSYLVFDPAVVKIAAQRDGMYALRKTKPSESAIDEDASENRADTGREGVETGEGQPAPGGVAVEGEGVQAAASDDLGTGIPDRALARIIRQESASLDADGNIIAGRPSRQAKASRTGGEGVQIQRAGRTEPFAIDGFEGRVTAKKLIERDTREGNLARLTYEIFEPGTMKPYTLPLGEMEITQRADGAWEVGYVEIRAPRNGIGTKLYDAVESDLGIRMSPSGVLSESGHAFWQKRSPASVQWHVKTPTMSDEAGNFYFSPRKVMDELDRIGHALKTLSSGAGWVMRISPAERETYRKQYVKERGELIKLYGKLPLEARAAKDQMFALTAFHGSPHDFDRFDLSRIGTGEGAQAFGHGLYFAENELTAKSYQEVLSGKSYTVGGKPFEPRTQTDRDVVMILDNAIGDIDGAIRNLQYYRGLENVDPEAKRYVAALDQLERLKASGNFERGQGQLYEVEIDVEPEQLLDWDRYIVDQTEIHDRLEPLVDKLLGGESNPTMKRALLGKVEPGQLYNELMNLFGSPEGASNALREAGIPGIRYLDQGSRGSGDGTRNIVIFDDSLVKITKKNGKPVTAEERQGAIDQMFSLRSGSVTETEAFKRWFGDSKVVDENGEPLVVYRGDRQDKEAFLPSDGDRIKGNVFFSDQRSIGEHYARTRGGGFYSTYLSLQNPFTIDAGGESWLEIPAPQAIRDEWGDPDKTIQIDELAAWARKQGYDGLIVRNVMDQWGGGNQFVAFEPTQIKSVDNRGTFDPTDPRISYALRGFYSPAIRAAEQLKQERGTGQQFWSMISKAPGVRRDELDWMGLEEFLADKPSITRDEVLAFMRAHQVELDEKVLGGGASSAQRPAMRELSDISGIESNLPDGISIPTGRAWEASFSEDTYHIVEGVSPDGLGDDFTSFDVYDGDWNLVNSAQSLSQAEHFAAGAYAKRSGVDEMSTKFEGYKVPGGTNYRELLIRLPELGSRDLTPEEQARLDALNAESKQLYDAPASMSPAENKLRRDRLNEISKQARQISELGDPRYESQHFKDQEIVHLRVDDRTGPNGERVLFINEVQSDLHQRGRKKGYKQADSEQRAIEAKEKHEQALDEKMREIFPRVRDGEVGTIRDMGNGEFEAISPNNIRLGIRSSRDEAIYAIARNYAYFHPAVKKLLVEAEALERESRSVPNAPFKGDLWLELALKRALLYASENGYDAVSWARSDQIAKAVVGDAEALSVQYDQKIGRFLSKYTKKWGGKVEEITFEELGPARDAREATVIEMYNDGVSGIVREVGQTLELNPELRLDDVLADLTPAQRSEFDEMVGMRVQASPTAATNPLLRITPEMRSSVMEGQPLAMRRQPPATQPEALGQTDPYTMSISIAMRAVEAEAKAKGVSTEQEAVRVLRHEAVEFFKAMGLFTEKEWNVLKSAAKRNGWVETTGVREAYESVYKGGMSETEMNDLLIKEAIAEQYSEFHLDRKQFKGVVAEVFQRIKDFIDRTASFMRGEGFQTWSDVFESIDQGELKARFEEAFPEMAPQPRTDTAAMQATAGKIPDSPARRATAGTERPTQSLADLVSSFNKALGLTVRQGRIDPGLKRAASQMGTDVRGQTSMATGVVRLRVPNEIDTLAHEGGHALENRFKGDLEAIKQTHAAELTPLASPGPDALSEGFAEWFRRYVTNPKASKRTAPAFEQEFEDFLDAQNPDMLASLQSIRDGYQEWIKAPSGGAVASSIATTVAPGSTKEIIREFKEEGLRNTFQNWTDRIYTAVFDDLHPMRLAVDGLLEIAKKNVKPALRKKLDVKATDNAYKLLRLARDGYAAGHMDIMHGVHGYKDINPQGPGLRDALVTAFQGSAQGRAGVLDPARRLVGIQPKADWNEAVATDFGAYLTSRRMVQEWGRFQNGDISAPPDKFSLADHQQAIKDFEAKYPGFAQGAQQVYEYLNNMLRKKRDAGLITSELYDELVGRQDYVPVMRDMSDRGGVEGRSAARKDKYSIISRFRGSQRDVINPLESIAKDSYETAMIIARNDALRALDALARAAGPDGGRFAERIPSTEMKSTQVDVNEAIKAASKSAGVDPADMQIMLQAVDDQLGDNTVAQIWRAGEISEKGEAIVYLWEAGKRIPIRLADGKFGHDMLHAVTGLNRESADWWVNLLSLPSTALRIGVTASLDFVLANYVRDQVSAWVLTRDFVPFYDGARGVYSDLTMQDVSRIYSRVGGIMGGANVAAQHESRVKREILQLRRKGVRFTLNPLTRDFWRMTEFSEAGTRLAVFQKAFDRAKTDGLTDWESAVEASFIARDYIDFGRRGSRMLAARRLVPFLNAALQGLDRGIRGLKGSIDADKVLRTVISPYIKSRTGQPLSEVEQGNVKQAAQAWGYMVALGMVGLGLSLLYKDDEEYEEISDYIKATHWLIRVNGEWVRIPKPFELAFFSNLVERTFDYTYKDDPTAVERFIDGLFHITVPPHSIPGVAVTTELAADYNFFTGRPIVGPFLKTLPPELQFNAYASEFGKWFGKQVGISPAYIDHFITGFGASYGREFVNASDMFMPALGKATDGAFGLPTKPVADPALQDYFFIRRFTTDPARGSTSVRKFWDLMSMENGVFVQAANGYRHLVDKVRDAKGAQEFLDRLPDEERAYALLTAGNSGNRAKYRRLHPLNRAQEIVSVTGGMKKEINLNRLYKGGDGKQIELTPQQMRTVSDLMSDISMREARNALIALKVRGWEQKKPIEVDTVYAEIEAAAPEVHKELVDRLKSKKLPSYIDVVKGWPIARERILEDGQKAIITDLYRRDFSIGQGAPLQ